MTPYDDLPTVPGSVKYGKQVVNDSMGVNMFKTNQNWRLQYEAANARRFQNFTFFWQATGLGLAAQAFLLLIALGGGTSYAGRYVASGLSIMTSAAALILMRTQRGYQEIEGIWMDVLEDKLGIPNNMQMLHRGKLAERGARALQAFNASNILTKQKWQTRKFGSCRLLNNATAWWCVLWWAFIGASTFVIIVTALRQLHCIPTNWFAMLA